MTQSHGAVVEQALLVAHDAALCEELRKLLIGFGVSRVVSTDDEKQAARILASRVEALFLWASMPNSLALSLVKLADTLVPTPYVVVVGEASHPDLFDLARAGARAYLRWPANTDEVRKCLEYACESAADPEVVVHLCVGQVDLKGAQARLRRAMLGKALSFSDGSRRAAARILGVTRPAVQRMIREDLDEEVGE